MDLCLHPSHEARDKHTRSEASQRGAQSRRAAPHRGPSQRTLPQRRAAALPPAEKRLPPVQEGAIVRGNSFSQKRFQHLTLLSAGLGSVHFAPEEQTKIIQALQVLHSTPCRQMFSCCALCVRAGEHSGTRELSVVLSALS